MDAFLCALLSVALPAPGPAAADVWEVGAGALATIGDAVALAADGDIVLVHAGTYPGFTLAGKSLVIVADADESAVIDGTVVVHSLAAAQTATLQGFKILGDPGDAAVRATLNDGALWIEDCEVRGSGGGVALQAVACGSVVLRRSSFQGSEGGPHSDEGEDAVVLRELSASVFSCSMTGGLGGVGGDPSECSCTDEAGGPGGNGMLAENSLVLVQASTLQGGKGGFGDCCDRGGPTHCGDGGHGGAGLLSLATGEITLVQSALAGGSGGSPGEGVCAQGDDGQAVELVGGAVIELAQVPRSLAADSPVREGQIASALASGEPSELLAIYASAGTMLGALPSVYGFQLLEPPLILVATTVLPASGILDVQVPVPELGTSIEGVTLRLQTASLPPSGGFVLGEAATLVLLDAAL